MKWKPKTEAEQAAADTAVAFISGLKHTKGRWAGVPFNLRPWQEHEIIRPLFGAMNSDGTRQYRTAYIEVPRKNGKSELAAAIALKLLFRDGEMGAQIYGAASDRDQATIVFNVAAAMVRKNPALAARCKIIDSQKRIVRHDVGSFYRAIPADAAGSHGFDASGIVFDELHTQPNRELWDVLTTSTGSRRQPLTFAITTAGYDRNSICWEVHEYAQKVIDGVIEDDTFFAYIRSMPEDADWRDEKEWVKCNPALGDFRSLDEMRALAKRAEHMPALQNTFRRLYGCQWTQQSDRWIDLALWDAQGRTIDEDNYIGRTFHGGLDLASVSDLTAWLMVFDCIHGESNAVDVVARFWVPQARLDDTTNRYRDQYRLWASQGYLSVTPGNSIDYAFVEKQIIEDAQRFKLEDMNIDRLFQGHQTGVRLTDELGTQLNPETHKHEPKVFAMGMTFMGFAAPMKELERLLLAEGLHHGGNPIMRFNADSVAVKQDAMGNLKPDKAASQGKIDGIVALNAALDRRIRHLSRTSVYESRGVLSA